MSFSESQVQQIWENGSVTPNVDSKKWRKDKCGAWIYRSSYMKNSEFGWLIDDIEPNTQNDRGDLSNLQPLHWENYMLKSLGNMNWVLTSQGNKNMRKPINRMDQIT